MIYKLYISEITYKLVRNIIYPLNQDTFESEGKGFGLAQAVFIPNSSIWLGTRKWGGIKEKVEMPGIHRRRASVTKTNK